MSDWNDIAVSEGKDQAAHYLHAAHQNTPILPPNIPAPHVMTISRESFEAELQNAAGDVSAILRISDTLQLSTLHEAEIELLLKMAAKLVGVSVSSLRKNKKKTAKKDAFDEDGKPVKKSRKKEDFVSELNEKHAIVPMGGRVFVMNQEHDPALNRPVYTFSAKQDFVLRYSNRKTYLYGEFVDIASAWLENDSRRQYDGLVFSPRYDVPGYFNLFQGFGTKAIDGCCDRFIDFMFDVICSGNSELFDYQWNWLAHLFQKPDELPGTAFVLRGAEGIGKNTFSECIGRLVGAAHFIQLSSIQQVVGRFSGHLADKLLVFANEAIWGGDKSAEGTLKHIISDDISSVEYKGKDIVSVKNYKRLIAASNEDWVIPRGVNDRRWIVIDVNDSRREDQEYFAAIKAELEHGGYEALMFKLINTDISNFNPRKIPMPLKMSGWELKLRSGGSVLQWWFSLLENGYHQTIKSDYAEDVDAYIWWDDKPKTDVHGLYLAWCEKHKISHPEMDCVMAKRLNEFGVHSIRKRVGLKNAIGHYVFQELDESRATLSKLLGIPATYWDIEEIDN